MEWDSEKTAMGVGGEVFQTTCWSDIHSVRAGGDDRRKVIINSLLERYWKPVYCYLRRKGYNHESAQDLTQGFFHEVVLGRELIKKADQAKGKFRTFLLTALDRYLIDIYRKHTTKKRLPGELPLSLGDLEEPEIPTDETPVGIFHRIWVSDLLDEVLAEVKKECHCTGKSIHWQVFNARVLAPIIDKTETPSLPDICVKYQIKDENRASNMSTTVKRQFRRTMLDFIRRYVPSDAETEEEFNELLNFFSPNGAG